MDDDIDLSITLTARPGYRPSERLVRAIAELEATLIEDHAETTGFSQGQKQPGRTERERLGIITADTGQLLTFMSIRWRVADGVLQVDTTSPPA